MPRLSLLSIGCAVLFMVIAAPSSAATYCVAPEASCVGGSNYATLQEALTAAADSPELDKIVLGAATYTSATTAGFDYTKANPVEIVGKGPSTIITGPAGTGTVLDLSVITTGGSLHDVRVTLPANAPNSAQALRSGILVTHVTVDANATQANPYMLVNLTHGANLTHSTLTADNSGAVQTIGVNPQDLGSTLSDDTITARTGIEDIGSTTIDRVKITAGVSGIQPGPGTAISNCLITLPGSTGTAITVFTTNITVTNCTLVGTAANPSTWGVYCSGAFGNSSVSVANTIVLGTLHSIYANTNVNPVSVDVRYSEYDPAAAGHSAGPATLNVGPGNRWDADLKFLDQAGGDLRPRYDSPLVDRGDPATTGSADLQNYQRVVDGDGTGGAAIDIGAYEYPRQGPEPQIDDGPSTGDVGVEYVWTGSAGDPDPGETPLLTYGWKVDGGALEPGATLHHTFTTAGTHALQFVATDVTGVVATIDYPVDIAAPAPPPDSNTTPPDGSTPPTPPVGDPVPSSPTPSITPTTTPQATGCLKALRFKTKLDRRLRTATARLAGKRLRVRHAHGRLVVAVDLRHRKPGVYRLRIAGRTASGKRVARTRRYRVCG